MLFKEDTQDIETSTGSMRVHRFYPEKHNCPGLILYSEIYQVTGPIARLARFFAGHGFIVYVPEVYHEFEPLGEVFKYNPEDTEKGNKYKFEKPVSSFDTDTQALIYSLLQNSHCNKRIGSFGVCLGGHLSYRAALFPEIRASVCAYGTNIHDASLGKGGDDSLKRTQEIKGELLMIWGRQDPHVPQEGRQLIYQELVKYDRNFSWHEFNAQHAFLRDEGYRYDPSLANICLNLSLELFQRVLV